jgi:2-deoxy-D-gluconate 3-dehydrogenase
MNDMFSLAGSTALITGAGSGIGAAASEALASAGASVILVGRDLAKLNRQRKRILSLSATPIVECVRCDVSRTASVKSLARTVLAKRSVDILVNNAGIVARFPAEELPENKWDAVLATNLKGPFLLSQLFGAPMLERGRGKIINIASMLSFTGGLNASAYAASKGGLASMTRAFASEWAGRGVNVNAIAPGWFHTEATSALIKDRKRYRSIRDRIPAGRWGETDELQGAFIFLASRASDYVHGHVLCVDGGYLVR